MIERLVQAKQLGQPVSQQTASWLQSIAGTQLRERLAKAGLCEAATATFLGDFLDRFVAQHKYRGDVTEATLIVWGHTVRNLKAYLGQGQRTLSRLSSKDFGQEGVVPGTMSSLHGNAFLTGMLFQKR